MAICSLSGTRLKRRITALLPPWLTSQEHERYRYTPLGTNQIRLLKLHPGQPGTTIECTIKAVDLHAYDDRYAECPDQDWKRFHAVSYTWGKKDLSVKIKCNGLIAYISQNLADALQAFREKDDLILWIDALCINQEDTSERAAQVKLMGLIYFKARRIRIWLGNDDEIEKRHTAEGAADLIKTFAELYWTCFWDPTAPSMSDFSKSIFEDPTLAQLPQWEGIRRLYRHSWFTRVWVVQELGLARDATFHCGDSHFDRDELEGFQRLMQASKQGRTLLGSINTQTTDLGLTYWNSARGGRRIELGEDPKDAESFFDILLASDGLQCTEPRDRVYAFLGHPSAFKRQLLDVDPYMWYPNAYYEEMSTIITPRYDKSYKFPTVCVDLAVAAVRERGLAYNVLACINQDHKTIRLNFPSWIPRWDVMKPPPLFPGSRTYYDASKGFSDAPFCVEDTGKHQKRPRLVCRAMRLSRVWFAIQDLNNKSPGWIADTAAQHLNDIPLKGQISHIKLPTASSYPFEDDFLLVLASSLTAGLTTDPHFERKPADEHKEYHLSIFKAWYLQQQALRIGMKISLSNSDRAHCFKDNYDSHHRSRSLFLTLEGRFGLGPRITKLHDEVWLLMGAKMPFVLRPTGKGTYKVIGQTFLYDAMRGEAVQGKCEEDFGIIVLE